MIRKPVAFVFTPILIALSLMLPAGAAAAADYPIKTIYNYCSGNADNTVNLKMRITARGYTDADGLTIDSWAQRRLSSGWQTVYRWDRATYSYTPDGNRHSLTAWRSYQGTNSHKFRIVFRLRAWDGGDVLHSAAYSSVRC